MVEVQDGWIEMSWYLGRFQGIRIAMVKGSFSYAQLVDVCWSLAEAAILSHGLSGPSHQQSHPRWYHHYVITYGHHILMAYDDDSSNHAYSSTSCAGQTDL